MTLKQLEKIAENVTCGKIRARARKCNLEYFKIEVWSNSEDKNFEFSNQNSVFVISDERIIPISQLEDMDKYTTIEIIRDMMLSIYLHEFNEFFKFKKKTVFSPHLNPKESK